MEEKIREENNRSGQGKKTLGVVGLGLIGGSFVKSYEQAEDWRILGYDKDEKINQFALLAEDIDGILTEDNVDQCDLILLAVYPEAAVSWLREHAEILAFMRELGLPEDETICGALALGYPDTKDGLPNRSALPRTGNPVTWVE